LIWAGHLPKTAPLLPRCIFEAKGIQSKQTDGHYNKAKHQPAPTQERNEKQSVMPAIRAFTTGCLIGAAWFVGTLLTTSSDSGVTTNDTRHRPNHPVGPYRLSTYPDAPTDEMCRHDHNPRLCDPDGILKESTMFPLDDDLEHRNVTITTRGSPQRGQVVPVQYGVAVMKKVSLFFGCFVALLVESKENSPSSAWRFRAQSFHMLSFMYSDGLDHDRCTRRHGGL
jgi:hypothetical protein